MNEETKDIVIYILGAIQLGVAGFVKYVFGFKKDLEVKIDKEKDERSIKYDELESKLHDSDLLLNTASQKIESLNGLLDNNNKEMKDGLASIMSELKELRKDHKEETNYIKKWIGNVEKEVVEQRSNN